MFGVAAGTLYAALQLAVRQLELRWGHDPLSVGGIIFGGIFFGVFFTLLFWSWTERRYRRALERRAEYDADRAGANPEESGGPA